MIWLYIVSLASAILMVVLSNVNFSRIGFHMVDSPLSVVSFIIGGLFVFIFYWIKFNEWAGEGQSPPGFRPRPVRHFTTWMRYLAWNSFYGMMMTVAYALFMLFPAQIVKLIEKYQSFELFKVLYNYSQNIDLFNGTVDLVPWVIIVITFVWSGMAPCARFEKRIRLYLQENAAIPSQARQLIGAFEDYESNFSPDERVVGEVIKKMASNTLEPKVFNDPGDSLWFLYARMSYLYHVLVKRRHSRIFSRFAERYIDEFNELDVSIENLQKDINNRLNDIQDLCFEGDEQNFTLKKTEIWLEKYLPKASKAEKAYFSRQQKELKNNLEDVSRDVIQLIVCSVLVVGLSRSTRKKLLSEFGLKNTDQILPNLDWATMIWVVASTILIVGFCTNIYLICQSWFVGEIVGIYKIIPSGPTEAIVWAIYACLMHSIAIGGGYFMQLALEINRQGHANEKRQPPPLRVQLAEAMLAASFGFILNVILLGLILFSQNKSSDLSVNLWWAAVPGVTAFFAALYSQNIARSDRQFKQLFFLQGLCTGLMALFIIFIIHNQKLMTNLFVTDSVNNIGKMYLIYAIYAASTCTLLGWGLGKIFKSWVMAERFSGEANRRVGPRRSHLFKQAKWITDSEEIAVRAVSVSSTGAELKSPKPLGVFSIGTFLLYGRKENAIVVRNDRDDQLRSFVQFLPE